MPLCAAIKEEKYKLTIIPVDFPRGKSTPGVLLCTVQKNSRMESKYNLEKFHEGEAGSLPRQTVHKDVRRRRSKCEKKDKGNKEKKKEKPEKLKLAGCRLGGGVLYRMFVTASSAVLERGRSVAGSGGGRSRAEVESSIGRGGLGGSLGALTSEEQANERVLRALEDHRDRRANMQGYVGGILLQVRRVSYALENVIHIK
ncbi:hypothetical protein PAXINDRAFT_153666 [Paxillus involutus ATCC 200175]|nr:hypothetical protein PAXINDRAFT_153666 [Paxillus involutus ATCC 200175]